MLKSLSRILNALIVGAVLAALRQNARWYYNIISTAIVGYLSVLLLGIFGTMWDMDIYGRNITISSVFVFLCFFVIVYFLYERCIIEIQKILFSGDAKLHSGLIDYVRGIVLLSAIAFGCSGLSEGTILIFVILFLCYGLIASVGRTVSQSATLSDAELFENAMNTPELSRKYRDSGMQKEEFIKFLRAIEDKKNDSRFLGALSNQRARRI
jgi:hypothetical protein